MFQRDLLQISPPEQLVVHYDKLRFKAFSINLYITNQPSFSSDESIGPLLQAALKKHWRRRSYWALLQLKRLACMLLLYWRLFSVEMFLLYSWQHWGSLQLATGSGAHLLLTLTPITSLEQSLPGSTGSKKSLIGPLIDKRFLQSLSKSFCEQTSPFQMFSTDFIPRLTRQ